MPARSVPLDCDPGARVPAERGSILHVFVAFELVFLQIVTVDPPTGARGFFSIKVCSSMLAPSFFVKERIAAQTVLLPPQTTPPTVPARDFLTI